MKNQAYFAALLSSIVSTTATATTLEHDTLVDPEYRKATVGFPSGVNLRGILRQNESSIMEGKEFLVEDEGTLWRFHDMNFKTPADQQPKTFSEIVELPLLYRASAVAQFILDGYTYLTVSLSTGHENLINNFEYRERTAHLPGFEPLTTMVMTHAEDFLDKEAFTTEIKDTRWHVFNISKQEKAQTVLDLVMADSYTLRYEECDPLSGTGVAKYTKNGTPWLTFSLQKERQE